MKKLLTILLSIVLILGIFTACGNNSNSGGEIINNTLSFSQANSIEEMAKSASTRDKSLNIFFFILVLFLF